ncbi:DUF2079 domain-containing protein [Oculatella sp. LEGE 06141]|uniref:DUF2079 domain-containing protein n=1 Tax=Oculatella sp. LEGE 06141 TaxID=1828648 RepID=UPI001881C0D7|nr:DUF2079 domain-containing protein [Oculatella sp. LEGE 06141]MBE9178329.1 DUF2079 domain-containing protein [Oculatella sp. LEGE 06141]
MKAGKHPGLRVVIGIAIVFWVLGAGLVLLRYYGYYPTYAAFDQGIFNQVFWNSLHGHFFQGSLSATESIAVAQGEIPEVDYRRLGQHFTPALLLWLPFYALFPSPAGLSVLQVLLVAIAGLVLYALARQYHPPQLSVWLTASYYAANAVIGPTLANFHDFSQIPLFVFGLLLALEKRWWWVFVGLSILTLLVREDAGVILFGVGFYLAVSRRYLPLGLAVCALSLAYMLLLTNWVMPLFSPDISQRFMVEEFGQFVEGDEASTLQVLWGILSNPGQLIATIFTPLDRTLRYLLAQWLPLAFIPVISPSAWALTGFPLLKLLMQQNPSALSIDRRFAITLVPGLFYGAILWWVSHPQHFRLRFRRIWGGCLLLALILSVTANPNRALSFAIPNSFQPWVYTSPARQWQHVEAIEGILANIPPDASVAATSYIVPHVSNRREVIRFPQLRLRNDDRQVVQVDYAVVDVWQHQQYQPAFVDDRQAIRRLVPAIDRLLNNQRYGIVSFQDGVVLLQRATNSNQASLDAWLQYRQELEPILELEAVRTEHSAGIAYRLK